jgi:hypothetical protein
MAERNPLPDCLSHLAQRDKARDERLLDAVLSATYCAMKEFRVATNDRSGVAIGNLTVRETAVFLAVEAAFMEAADV